MPEPASAIIGVIGASVSLAETIYKYTSSYKDAPKYANDLAAEVSAVGAVLGILCDYLKRENAKGKSFERTSVLFFAVNGCNQRLKEVHDRLSPMTSGSGAARFLQRLKWPLDEDGAEKAVAALHRYAQIFEFSLSVDGFSIISTNQAEALSQLREKLDVLSHGVAQSEVVNIRFQNVLDAVATLPGTAVAMESIREKLDQLVLDERMSKLLDSLPSLPFQDKHRDLQIRRTAGLGQWLLNMPAFVDWRDGAPERNTLWCHGAPGAGKTYLTSVVVDHLLDQIRSGEQRVVYFYFDYREQSEQTPFNVLTCLLKQILSTYPSIPDAASELYQRIKCGQGLPGWEDLITIFFRICSGQGDLFLILDALDECDENTHRVPILRLLERLVQSPVRLFVTSRPHSLDINSTFADSPHITIEATDSDIRAFLDAKMNQSKRMSLILDEPLRQEILQFITEKSQGMFLLPALQIGNILSQTNKRQVKKALRELPSGLIQNLDLTMERIKKQDPQSQARADLAVNTLMWLSNAKRTLTIDELRHAIGATPDVASLDPTELTDAVFFTECCLGLITIDHGTSTVRLIHLSVNEYLQERRESLFPRVNGTLAVHCLTYLLMDDFRDCLPLRKGVLDALLLAFPFLDYAAMYWGDHAAQCYDTEVEETTRKFLANGPLLSLWSQIIEAKEWSADHIKLRPEESVMRFVVQDISALHVAARFGIRKLAEDALNEAGSNPNLMDSWGQTPLVLAASRGQLSIMDLLLSRDDIDPNLIDRQGKTALRHAVINSQVEGVRMLISHLNVDVNLGNPLLHAVDDYTTLRPFLSQSKGQIAKLLTSRPDLDINALDGGEAAWEKAAKNGDFDTLQLLLTHKELDPSAGETLLPGGYFTSSYFDSLAESVCAYLYYSDLFTEEAYVNFVRILRAFDQDPRFDLGDFNMLRMSWPILLGGQYHTGSGNTSPEPCGIIEAIDEDDYDIYGRSPQFRANIARALELHGCTLSTKDSHGRTYLHFAAWSNEEGAVEFLLERGADSTAADNSGWTPLHWAALRGGESIAIMLLDSGAEASATANNGWSVLHSAARGGNKSLVRLLLSQGADIRVRNGLGSSVLHAATLSDTPISVMTALLALGADLSSIDSMDATVLHEATMQASAETCEFLLKKGLNPNARSIGGTPLQLAVHLMDDKKILKFLEYGADPHILDCFGRSSLDWIASFKPLSEYMKTISYKKTPPDVTRCQLLDCLRERIDLALASNEGTQNVLLYRLGKQLLFLNDDASARIAFEGRIDPNKKFGVIKFYDGCDNCASTRGTRFYCRSCAMTVLCSSCVKQLPHDALPWCRDHDFLEVSGKGYRDRPRGVVNEEGRSREEWLADLKIKYASAGVD